ncbi:MAG: DUF6194 family protein [Verrucomicrobiota bacterium]
MNEATITQYIIHTFPEVETTEDFGYTFFFYGSDHKLPFATLAASDNEYDSVSKLDREGVFRLNIGISKETFQSLFGKDKVVLSDYDFTALDRFIPHPHYAPQHFICVLNPSEVTSGRVSELLAEAYGIAVRRRARQGETQ